MDCHSALKKLPSVSDIRGELQSGNQHLVSTMIRASTCQLAEVKNRGEIAIRGDLVAAERGLNPRQAAALDHIQAHRRLTVRDLEDLFPSVSRRSLQRDLKALVDQGLLKEAGASPTDPTRHYVLGGCDKL